MSIGSTGVSFIPVMAAIMIKDAEEDNIDLSLTGPDSEGNCGFLISVCIDEHPYIFPLIKSEHLYRSEQEAYNVMHEIVRKIKSLDIGQFLGIITKERDEQ